jgi:hypothetical protein
MDQLPDFEPCPPGWALDAGLPEPDENETFRDYVNRLGFSYHDLTRDLTWRTHCVAHVRLANAIADACPDAWRRHLDEFVKHNSIR